MNHTKIQQEIIKALCAERKISAFRVPEAEKTFITVDRVVGYLIPDKQLHVSLAGTQNAVNVFGDSLTNLFQSVQLTGTDEYQLGGQARKYIADRWPDTPVYVKTSILKNFEAPTLYTTAQREEQIPLAVCVVAEEKPFSEELEIVGLVCPVRIKDEEETEE